MNILEGGDGVDFINIYSKGKTELGRWLSNFTQSPITIPEHGKFESIEGYWYWLSRGKDDRLRPLYGFQAKKMGRTLEQVHVEGFEDFIRKAIDIKLKSYPDRMLALAETTLPMTHFYEYGGRRIDAGFEWIVKHFEDRRTILKNYFEEKRVYATR